ncbi:MAG: hypothetical protein WKF96_21755 [Solirubrobacteraceae bacterium]
MRKLTIAAVAAAFLAAAMPTAAPAHRSGCHPKYVCPSDHATYKWRGKLCVKPTSNKRTSAFKTKVRYDGLTYYCKR